MHAWKNNMGSYDGQLLADAIRTHANFEQIAQNMFDGEAKVDMSKQGLDAGDAHIMAAALEKNDTVTQVDASGNALGNAGAKAFGDSMLVNQTILHLNVSDNGFGKVQAGDQVKLKDGSVKRVFSTVPNPDYLQLEGDSDSKMYGLSNYTLVDIGVPAFCAGLAALPQQASVVCIPAAARGGSRPSG